MSTEALGRYMMVEEMRMPNAQHRGQWRIRNKKDLTMLALVEWYKPWKRYAVVWMSPDAVSDGRCCRDIADFLDKVNNNERALQQAKAPSSLSTGTSSPATHGTSTQSQ